MEFHELASLTFYYLSHKLTVSFQPSFISDDVMFFLYLNKEIML